MIAPGFSQPLVRRELLSHFLPGRPLQARRRRQSVYFADRCSSGRHPPTYRGHGQANLPAEQSSTPQAARVPRPHADTGGTIDPCASSREGSGPPVRLAGRTRRTSIASSVMAGRFTQTGWYCSSRPGPDRRRSSPAVGSAARLFATGPGASCGPRGGSWRPGSWMGTTWSWSPGRRSPELERTSWCRRSRGC